MKRIMLLPLLIIVSGCVTEPPAEPSAEAQSELTEVLAGRVAGEPQSCVRQYDLDGNRTVGGALVFDTKGRNVVYVNNGDCPELRSGRALKTRSTINQLCRGDIVEIFDPSSGISYGSCGLGDFTPYRRSR